MVEIHSYVSNVYFFAQPHVSPQHVRGISWNITYKFGETPSGGKQLRR